MTLAHFSLRHGGTTPSQVFRIRGIAILGTALAAALLVPTGASALSPAMAGGSCQAGGGAQGGAMPIPGVLNLSENNVNGGCTISTFRDGPGLLVEGTYLTSANNGLLLGSGNINYGWQVIPKPGAPILGPGALVPVDVWIVEQVLVMSGEIQALGSFPTDRFTMAMDITIDLPGMSILTTGDAVLDMNNLMTLPIATQCLGPPIPTNEFCNTGKVPVAVPILQEQFMGLYATGSMSGQGPSVKSGVFSLYVDPLIVIDPDAEFAPGMRYADFFAIEVSPEVNNAIPEPGTALLFATGLAGLGFAGRGRSARRATR